MITKGFATDLLKAVIILQKREIISPHLKDATINLAKAQEIFVISAFIIDSKATATDFIVLNAEINQLVKFFIDYHQQKKPSKIRSVLDKLGNAVLDKTAGAREAVKTAATKINDEAKSKASNPVWRWGFVVTLVIIVCVVLAGVVGLVFFLLKILFFLF